MNPSAKRKLDVRDGEEAEEIPTAAGKDASVSHQKPEARLVDKDGREREDANVGIGIINGRAPRGVSRSSKGRDATPSTTAVSMRKALEPST